jgi:hypothetical protein
MAEPRQAGVDRRADFRVVLYHQNAHDAVPADVFKCSRAMR